MAGLVGSLDLSNEATQKVNLTMEDTLKLQKRQVAFNKKMDEMERRRIKRKQEQFLAEKELQALQLRAAGDNAAAEALEKQIELTRKAIEISEKYKISLMEAAKLTKGIDDQEKARLQKEKEREKEKETNRKIREEIDQSREGGGDERGDFAKVLEGEKLKAAANEAGKEFGVRFQKEISNSGEVMFRKFKDGFAGALLTEEQLRAGLERAVELDPSNETLERIATLLEGRLTNT